MKIKYIKKKMNKHAHSYIGSYDINNEGLPYKDGKLDGFREYTFFEAVDVDFCCEKMNKVYETTSCLHFADIEETGEIGLCIMNRDDWGYFPLTKIDYCPFCGEKIVIY